MISNDARYVIRGRNNNRYLVWPYEDPHYSFGGVNAKVHPVDATHWLTRQEAQAVIDKDKLDNFDTHDEHGSLGPCEVLRLNPDGSVS